MIDPVSIILGIAGGVISNAIYSAIQAYRAAHPLKKSPFIQNSGKPIRSWKSIRLRTGVYLLKKSLSAARVVMFRNKLEKRARHHGPLARGSYLFATPIKPAFDFDIAMFKKI